MKYNEIVSAYFLERPNRFIAYVDLQGKREKVHVKNTGRCRELLTPGAKVFLEKSDSTTRSTAFDLVAVEKGDRLINMDSQATNKAAKEFLEEKLLFPDTVMVRPEKVYGNSRFDFYVETSHEKIFIEVKGVTLENDNVVSFPDAPSERAVKHVEELIQAKRDGYRVFVMFVIQMQDVKYFTPAEKIHPQFAEVLYKAYQEGVEILAYDCMVTPGGMNLRKEVPIRLRDRFIEPYDSVKENLSFEGLAAISNPLLEWYDKSHRILPWREEPTPYRVWVSEIMLQQTRVEAVKPYFERFMRTLPDIRSLARADEETLLKLWEGLGYYNRVRNLQKAAIQIEEQYGGVMPQEYEELLTLTGIGNYTAGAISSIAYGKKHPAVDGNVLRVVSRLQKDERLISDTKVKAAVEDDLQEIMSCDRPGDFNQAMMELGACICIPNGAPLCEQCPLKGLCLAHRDGTELNYPKKQGKSPRSIEKKTILVIRDAERVALRKREAKGLLAGMYEFPSVQGHLGADEVTEYLEQNGVLPLRVQELGAAKHIFSHKEWHMIGYMVRVDELAPKNPADDVKDWIYIEPSLTREKYPIPSAFSAYTDYLHIKLGVDRYKED